LTDVSEFLESYNETLRQELVGADMPPELLERFTFDSCVKQQDGREVYFVTQKTNGLRAVLRITDSKSGESAAAESAILAKLDHPAIPKTLGVWEYNGRGYLVREYFTGDDLHSYVVKNGTLSRERLTDIVLQLCDILTYIHTQSTAVIHRDIKPENIIIDVKNNVNLIDFGIARDVRKEAEKDTQIAGTRPYMAPEQFGSEQTDNRADIYSLGVVMIYLATGMTEKQNLRATYPFKELVSIIGKCIKNDRNQRFKTAGQLKKRILRARNRVVQNTLVSVVVCMAIAAALVCGFYIGQERGYESGFLIGRESGYEHGYDVGHIEGFESGVDYIMDVPVTVKRPFTQEELYEPITFENRYLDMAVRNALNKAPDDIIYRNEVADHVDEIIIYGMILVKQNLNSDLEKLHVDRDVVTYIAGGRWHIVDRGDISSLDDIPNAHSLRTLMLASQSISDLSPLEGMNIETLHLSDNFIGNLLPLRGMYTLRELDVCQNPLRDLTPISRLLSLTHLDISHTQVVDLSPIAELTRLEVLNMAFCDVEDISALERLVYYSLREVDLSYSRVTSLMPLVNGYRPVIIRCTGLPVEVLDEVRDMNGIILIDGTQIAS